MDKTKADNDMLTIDASTGEIHEAVKQINSMKASGPDGMQAMLL